VIVNTTGVKQLAINMGGINSEESIMCPFDDIDRLKDAIARSKRRRAKEFVYLKVDQLKDGHLYKINARNASYGIWIAEHGHFIISRVKMNTNFLFEEIHWDLSDHFGTVRPLMEIEKSPFRHHDFDSTGMQYREEKEILKYLNGFERR